MLTPDYLLHVSEGAEAISARLHTDITKRITQRIIARQKRGDDYILTSADKWRIESLMDAGYLRDDLMADIAAATGKELQEIKEAFEDAGIRSAAYDDRIYKAAGLEPTPFKQSPYMQRVMQRNYDATAQLWQNYTATTADAAQQTFINAMDDIYMKVASGSMSYTEAYAEAIDDLARNGVDLGADSGETYVAYKSGHRDTIEVATLRCVRTGISQMTAQIGEARMDEMGVDLVIVSSHLGARPDHQVWQGKIYSRSGTDKKYPNFRESTHYGEGAGLCGWNCRHQFSPYFEGMDNPFTDYDKEENLEVYEQTQQQRAMERAIRKSRRATEVLRDSVYHAEDGEFKEKLKELSYRADKRLKRQLDAYSAYCDEHDLKPLPERLRIARASRATGRTNLDKIEVKKTETNQTEVNVLQTEPKKTETVLERAEKCTTVEQVQDVLRSSGWFSIRNNGIRDIDENQECSLIGADLESAKSIVRSYQSIFDKYPQLIGKFGSVKVGNMVNKGAIAECSLETGHIHASPKYYADYKTLSEIYDGNRGRFYSRGKDASCFIIHELGHAVDGYLTKLGLGGSVNVSQVLRKKVMKACGLKISDTSKAVGGYASKNYYEWFAECFAEYATSDNPRPVAAEFGRRLEALLEGVT